MRYSHRIRGISGVLTHVLLLRLPYKFIKFITNEMFYAAEKHVGLNIEMSFNVPALGFGCWWGWRIPENHAWWKLIGMLIKIRWAIKFLFFDAVYWVRNNQFKLGIELKWNEIALCYFEHFRLSSACKWWRINQWWRS